MANRVRAQQLLIRVTPEEKVFIREKMKAYGTNNFNRYARKMLLNGYVLQVDLTDFHKLADEVNKIGVNINQIARTVNITGTIYSDDMNLLKERVDEV